MNTHSPHPMAPRRNPWPRVPGYRRDRRGGATTEDRLPRARAAAALGLCWFVALAAPVALSAALADDPAEPIRNEDVVRALMTGRSEAEVIAWIGSSTVEFDLTDEMRDEMAIAGVGPKVLQAMVDRQAAQEAALRPPGEADPVEAPEGNPGGEPTLTLRLAAPGADDAAEPVILRVIDIVPPEIAEALGLRNSDPRFTDIAIFVGCRTQDHVPDHWRRESPLGRDFLNTPRHRVLAFAPGATRTDVTPAERGGKKAETPTGVARPALLELAVPTELAIALEAEVAHDLTVGIALQADGRWFLFARDDRDGVVLDGDLPLEAVVGDGGDPGRPELSARFR